MFNGGGFPNGGSGSGSSNEAGMLNDPEIRRAIEKGLRFLGEY